LKKVKRLARPKTGRKTYTHSFSLTPEQIAWLETFPNASELLRKLIDDMMAMHGEVEPQLSLLALKHELDILESELSKTEIEKWEWVRKLREYDPEKRWELKKSGWDVMYDRDPDDPNNFIPTQNTSISTRTLSPSPKLYCSRK
jgi:hypothetical protein